MSLEKFLETGWAEHGDQPDAVAARLSGACAEITSAADAAGLARIATHVFGEHLGRWDEGIALLNRIADHPACDAAARAQLARSLATLRHASGEGGALDALACDDQVAALAGAAAIFAGRGQLERAIEDYGRALWRAEAGIPDGSPALRALAVTGNNLASALEEKPARSERETEGMVVAAQAALTYWKRAGGWLEEERAEYRLTRSLLQAERAAEAAAAAKRCVAVCAANDAPPFERFFAHAVLALAARVARDPVQANGAKSEALKWHEQISDDEIKWCEVDFKELMS